MGNGLGDAKNLSGGAGKVAPRPVVFHGIKIVPGGVALPPIFTIQHKYSLSGASIHYPELGAPCTGCFHNRVVCR